MICRFIVIDGSSVIYRFIYDLSFDKSSMISSFIEDKNSKISVNHENSI